MTDSVEGITEYTYDALGQLLTEKHMAVGEEAFTDVNVMTYDGYGNILTKNGLTYTYGHRSLKDRLSGVGIGDINPFRYRGYYFDKEIGMYYLQSRYYDPEVGRFVNGDEVIIVILGAYNLFAYCDNNIVNY